VAALVPLAAAGTAEHTSYPHSRPPEKRPETRDKHDITNITYNMNNIQQAVCDTPYSIHHLKKKLQHNTPDTTHTKNNQ
jgi:hypothetical protein